MLNDSFLLIFIVGVNISLYVAQYVAQCGALYTTINLGVETVACSLYCSLHHILHCTFYFGLSLSRILIPPFHFLKVHHFLVFFLLRERKRKLNCQGIDPLS